MQHDLDLLCPVTRKRETIESQAIVLEFGATEQQKENDVRANSGGLLQKPVHSTLQCANIRQFRLPR